MKIRPVSEAHCVGCGRFLIGPDVGKPARSECDAKLDEELSAYLDFVKVCRRRAAA